MQPFVINETWTFQFFYGKVAESIFKLIFFVSENIFPKKGGISRNKNCDRLKKLWEGDEGEIEIV